LSASNQVKKPMAPRRSHWLEIPSRQTALLFFAAALLLALASLPALAQEESTEEVVANLAAGRVLVAVTKVGIVIATLENKVEPDTRPPLIVPLGSRRAAVLLGAFNWVAPGTGASLARLDKELPKLRGNTVAASTPHLQQGSAGGEAEDIEIIGKGVLGRLSEVAKHLHTPIAQPAGEPLLVLLIADYVEGYGPEVWKLSYPVEQEPLRGDFWQTRVLPPRYDQLWPPEKGQPRTLMETQYPLQDASPPLLDLLRRDDARLARIRTADPRMSSVAGFLTEGQSQKCEAADMLQFLRASLDAIAPAGATQLVAVISEKEGFDWVLAPPAEPKKPGEARPPGAPTLAKPPR
jgi:hypothetical protein